MKRLSIVMSVVCLLSLSAIADFNWNVESGYWSDGANWLNTSTSTTGTKPDGSANVNVQKSATSICTLNTDEGLFTNRLIIKNGATLNIENGGRVGFAWSRVGRNNTGTVNMTGNGVYVLNNDDLYIGVDAGGDGYLTMSDTSSITVNDSGANLGDNLYIAQNESKGKLTLIGSQVTVHTNEFLLADAKTASTNPQAILEYVMDANGASRIITDVSTWILNGTVGANAKADLLVSASAGLAHADIVLIECLGANAIKGAGVFSSLNGGSAAEGTQIVLGGNTYALTYTYAVDGISLNDIALVYIPEPATLLLFAIGGLISLKGRQK